MDRLKIPAFSAEIRRILSPATNEFVEKIPIATQHAYRTVELFDQLFDLELKGDWRVVFNQYVDAVFASSLLKEALLNRSIIEAVNRYDFLSYALAGRSLIENTATIRYYIEKKIHPFVKKCIKNKSVSDGELKQAIDHLHHLLMGSRFDWPRFFEEGFDALSHDYTDYLKRKKKDKHAGKWKAKPLLCQQINVATCLESWANEEPRIGVLYDLFCDMVHPNIGSTLCILTPAEKGIKFVGQTKDSFGVRLFDISYGPLQSLVGKAFAKYITFVIHLKFQEDELQGSQSAGT